MSTPVMETTPSEAVAPAGYASMQEFNADVLKKVVQTTQRANTMATTSEDHEYWSSFNGFQEFCTAQGSRLVQDIGRMLRHQAVPCHFSSEGESVTGLASVDIDERFEKLVEANDFLIENVSSLLDEASGLKKDNRPILPAAVQQSKPVISSWNRKRSAKQADEGSAKKKKSHTFRLLMAKNIQRPQLKWIDTIDNSNTPFMPKLGVKPNALKPFTHAHTKHCDPISQFVHEARLITDQAEDGDAADGGIVHPYSFELSALEPRACQFERREPRMYGALEETPLNMVDSPATLAAMMEKLRGSHEVAVDLEYHSYRSFQGFVCLMQISTRDEDFIVDTLVLRNELAVLNEVFTDPDIVKVFHGADSDIGWLQNDFGVYVVNMFDTGQASRVLQEERFSLAYLLKKYCSVDADKQYQLADWRIRPLPTELLKYAREDTHYLLYVYDCVRNQLLDKGNELSNLLVAVYSKSTQLCGTLYQKPIYTDEIYMEIYTKYRGRLNQQQLECFRLIYGWRDRTGREEDESLGYVLPVHMLFQIAENLPKEPQGVIACCTPVPPLVKQRVADIHQLVMQARDFTYAMAAIISSSSTHKELEEKKNTGKASIYEASPTGFEIYPITGPPVDMLKPQVSVLSSNSSGVDTEGHKTAKLIWSMLRSPFEMYLSNTGKLSVAPDVINTTWQQLSQREGSMVS